MSTGTPWPHVKLARHRSWLLGAPLVAILLACAEANADSVHGDLRVPILVYHRFGAVAADSMTVTTRVFEAHLRYLRDHDYSVIPLRQLVDHLLGKGPAPPPRAVVITADDGHRSVYTEMLPLVVRYRIPVTLFIYPSAISRADYALTWDQLREMHQTGWFDVQSHTYWHPNFKTEKKRLTPGAYEQFVMMQLTRSRDRLRQELGGAVDMLAWPFGIYDDELIGFARAAGYIAAGTLERRPVSSRDKVMALPRYLMTNGDSGKVFERLLAQPAGGHTFREAAPPALSSAAGALGE
jgi:peptidoglycan/xylan/chitin deacetylase (PgdA/CDA1 family)